MMTEEEALGLARALLDDVENAAARGCEDFTDFFVDVLPITIAGIATSVAINERTDLISAILQVSREAAAGAFGEIFDALGRGDQPAHAAFEVVPDAPDA